MTILDIFCGLGTFPLPLVRERNKIAGIEIVVLMKKWLVNRYNQLEEFLQQGFGMNVQNFISVFLEGRGAYVRVIYGSVYGHTQKYAETFAESLMFKQLTTRKRRN